MGGGSATRMIPGVVVVPAAHIGVRGGMAVSEGVDMIPIALEERIKQLLHATWAHNLRQHTGVLRLCCTQWDWYPTMVNKVIVIRKR